MNVIFDILHGETPFQADLGFFFFLTDNFSYIILV